MATRKRAEKLIHEMAQLKSEQQAGDLEGCGISKKKPLERRRETKKEKDAVHAADERRERKVAKKGCGYSLAEEVDREGKPTGKKVRVAHHKSDARAEAARKRYNEPGSKLKERNEMVHKCWEQGKKKDPSYSYKQAMRDCKGK